MSKLTSSLFVAGIPGAGKSNFGRWLEQNKGFIHVDMETKGLDEHGLREPWQAFCTDSGDHAAFPRALEELKSPVCLDWGFPVHCIRIVERLKSLGIRMVWFEADRLEARRCYLQKPGTTQSEFDCQVAKISLLWSAIEQIVSGGVVKTIVSDGTRLEESAIYELISKQTRV